MTGTRARPSRAPLDGDTDSDADDSLAFTSADPRVRALNDKPVATRAEYVLYWAQMTRRPDDNAALAYAVARANDLGLPCVVYEAVRPDYPYASDRFHTFLLEGGRDMADGLKARGLAHAFFLPRTAAEARGVVAKMAARAALVVTDDHPVRFLAMQTEAAAKRAPCTFFVVDDAAGVPMSLFEKQEY
ncbi:hypothetical protein EON77_10860, partial [bacterium]